MQTISKYINEQFINERVKFRKDEITVTQSSQHDLLVLPAAKNDQEIYDRIDLLNRNNIQAASGSGNAATDILVSKGKAQSAVNILINK